MDNRFEGDVHGDFILKLNL